VPDAIQLLDPALLWLLVVPAALVAGWVWQLARHRAVVRACTGSRTLPDRERLPAVGELGHWLCVLLALTCVILALARPQARVALIQGAGLDLVILQDGSTSMRVTDVAPDRWRRSTAWLRTCAEPPGLSRERVALALFTYRPAPQVRLTRDPNAFFFFLDYLKDEPPFRLEDDTSWDTNIEEGIYWGVRMLELNEELYGRRRSAEAFIVVSDGQDWSEEVGRSIALARARGARIYVVGVGTTAGGLIPDLPPRPYQEAHTPIHSSLDRRSLRAIAAAGGGQYHELDTARDDEIALAILTDVQRRAQSFQREEVFTDLYWPLLVAAAGFVGLGAALVRERARLWWQLGIAVGVVALLV